MTTGSVTMPSARADTAFARAVPTTTLGGMPIAALDMTETAELMLSAAESRPRPNRPLFLTSVNGEVLSRVARDQAFARIMAQADLVSADGQSLVLASRCMGARALPERVATTDLFHIVAEGAIRRNLTFYLLGASEAENQRAVDNVRRMHPGLRIVGHSHGYLQGDALAERVRAIDALAPDILWLALGVPLEQRFVQEFAPLLPHVGIIKTSGGLFNFLSGSRTRAPNWMQRWSLEWLWRIKEEPSRLFWRYATTNPHAMFLMIARSRAVSGIRASLHRAIVSRISSFGRVP